jgi:RNA polymerase sigma factor (sigma-70 family)
MKTHQERTNVLFKKMRIEQEKAILYRNMIVEENLKLVSHVLKKWRPYTDDQFQAGCMGLIVAVDSFKEEREVPFSSYACFCIEREMHRQHRNASTLIENILNDKMVYLNALVKMDDDEVSQADLIADLLSEERFDAVIQENDLASLFDIIIQPCVHSISRATKGQNTKVDLEKWAILELRYLSEAAKEESQKTRFNMTQMANILGTSVQNIRTRHQRVINKIKERCEEMGYYVT